MLADNLAMTDLDGRHVRGWLDSLLPPALRHRAPRWALLVCDGGQLVHAVVSGRGAIDVADVPFTGTSRAELAAVSDALGVATTLAVTPQAFDDLAADAERAIALDEHYTAQALHWVTAVRKQNRKSMWLDPPLLDLIPPLSADALERAFDLFVPNDSALAAYVIADDRKSIEASVIAVKRDGRIAQVSTHAALRSRLADRTLASSWTSQYRHALDLINAEFEPVSIAVFIEKSALRRILGGPPDQLSRELKGKTAIIDPMPRWLAGLLGGAAVMGAASRGAKTLGNLLPARARKAASAVAKSASRKARESGAHPWQVLGFDPVKLFAKVQRYYREP